MFNNDSYSSMFCTPEKNGGLIVPSEQLLSQWYESNGIVRLVVDKPADEMLRAGFCIESEFFDDATKSKLMAYIENIGYSSAFATALKWADLFGGAVIVMIINDGGELFAPLNVNAIKAVEQLRVYDRFRVYREEKYNDPADKRYGQTKLYRIHPQDGVSYQVHESRLLVIDGASSTDYYRSLNDGWGASVVNAVHDEVNMVNNAFKDAAGVLKRAQQAVYSVSNLSQILSTQEGETLMQKRIALIDQCRSIQNMIVIDGEEKYELQNAQLGGIDQLLSKFISRFCAVTNIPESVLMGMQRGGLSGSSDDRKIWHEHIARLQKQRLLPALDKFVSHCMRALGFYTDSYTIEFNPLSTPNEREKAEIEKLEADTERIEAETAAKYAEIGALDPSEIRNTLADDYPIDTTINNLNEPSDGEEGNQNDI